MGTWVASKEVEVETGSLEPRSYVGSAFLIKGKDLYIVTWRGDDEWESEWSMQDEFIYFEHIKTPNGTIVAWGSQDSIRRYIPLRHASIAEKVASKYGRTLYDEELQGF